MIDDNDRPTPRDHAGASLQPLARLCKRCNRAFAGDDYYRHRCVERAAGTVITDAEVRSSLRDMAVRQAEAGMAAAPRAGSIVLSALYLVAAIVALIVAVLLGGCASTHALQVSVRRVDSLAQLDIASEAMGGDGWRIVSVVSEERGTFVVVYERKAGARWE